MSQRSSPNYLVPDSLGESLVPEVVALSARRLGIAAAIAAAVYVVYIVLYRTIWAHVANALAMLLSLVGLACSVAVALYLLSGPRSAKSVVAVGMGYEVCLTLTMAISECWTTLYRVPSAQVSWTAVVIVLFPFLVPARPRAMLLASLVAAAMTPLAMVLVFGSGARTTPPLDILGSYVLPPFACALLAWAPSRALAQLSDVARRAKRLGSYELTRQLGAGGMGEVWLARHRLLARPAAVKLIKPEVLGAKDSASRETIVRRFEREAQVTANLESPHTVELFDFGVSPDGTFFYVMELLQGVDLDTLVSRFGPQPSERVVHLLLQACDSLDDAHRRGLIHRDIKPANLFVSRKGGTFDFVKVLDFGLVKRADSLEARVAGSLSESLLDTQHTVADQVIGTPAFMAPEAIVGEQVVDHRADLYALGCVGYWMLTGELLFSEKTTVAMLTAHLVREPTAPSERTTQPVQPELERIVLSCLRKNRDERPASADALRAELLAVPLANPWTREHARQWWEANLPQ